MPNAETITSTANPLLKDVRRAIGRGGLTQDGLCVAETFHLLEEALRSHCEVKTVLLAESAESRVGRLRGIRVAVLPDPLLQSLSGTESAQGVIALVKPPVWTADDLFRDRPLILVLDGVQDPGNAGTIIRAAEAFGATGAVFLKGSVSPHNPKTLRASAGSLFRVPYVFGVETGVLQRPGVTSYAAVPKATATLTETDLTAPCSLVIGSEAHGVSAELRATSRGISIPTAGVESLNAAMSATILLYEARRQRSVKR
jgi:TrmH family RNA methyltransferase